MGIVVQFEGKDIEKKDGAKSEAEKKIEEIRRGIRQSESEYPKIWITFHFM